MVYIAQQNTSYSAATWANVAYWKEGSGAALSVAPVAGDSVYANGKTLTMDVADTYGNLYTTAYTGSSNNAVAGGGFSRTLAGTHTGNVTAGTSVCLSFALASPNALTIVGSAYGGSASGCHGVSNSSSGIINITSVYGGTYVGNYQVYCVGITNGSGTLNITNVYNTYGGFGAYLSGAGTINCTNVYGGSVGGYPSGLVHYSSTGVVNVTNAYGGSGVNSFGVFSASTGTVYVTNAYGSQACYGVMNNTTGLCVVQNAVAFPPPPASYVPGTLPSWISSALTSSTPGAMGVYNVTTGPCYIQRGYCGLFGMFPTAGNVKYAIATGTTASYTVSFITPVVEVCEAASNVWATPGTMYDLVETTNQNLAPVPANVRSGTVYGAAGGYTGTMVVPAASNVTLNVPVDNTVGAGIITPASLASNVPSSSSIAGAVAASVVDGTYTLSQVLKIVAAVTAGKVSGGPGSPVFRNLTDVSDVVSGTADASGNRSAVTLNP